MNEYTGIAKSLRWLGNMFPESHPAIEEADRMCNCIHLYCNNGADVIEEMSSVIDNLNFLLSEPRWISVKERLPEEKVNVIIAVADMYYNMGDNTGVVIGWRYGDWYTYTAKGCEKINYPIAWLPLPEPPKGTEDEI